MLRDLTLEQLWDYVSDFHKSVYGFRYDGPADVEVMLDEVAKMDSMLEFWMLSPQGREQMREDCWMVDEPVPVVPAHYDPEDPCL